MNKRSSHIQQLILVAALTLLLCGCLRLDSFMFDPKHVSNYQLDLYTGDQECRDAIGELARLGYPIPHTREVRFTSGTETIYAIFLYNDSVSLAKDTMLLYFHGKAHHIDFYWPRARLLCATGYPVLIVDYRGFGKSGGKTTETNLYEDGDATLRFIDDSLAIRTVIIYGFSLGSAVACDVASRNADGRIVKKLLLEAPIGSAQTIAQDGSLLNLPGSFVTDLKCNNAEKIKNFKSPLLWLHGTCDEVLKRETHGLRIWNNYPGTSGKYIKINGATHTNIPTIIGYEKYLENLRLFIQSNTVTDSILP
ncbi:MAG: alpha/beta fold hydrolase [Chitinivibrionales bacterium]|nr:alpha/beta fold hydrolase [Chitinivibrionales bacterium]